MKAGASTFEEALKVAFAEEGVIDYDNSKDTILHTKGRKCPFKSLRLIIEQDCLRDFSDISDLKITEPFTVFPGVFLVTGFVEGFRLLFIPRRDDLSDPRTWTIPRLTLPEKSGAYDVLEKMIDFFNYVAGVGTYPKTRDPDDDFFGGGYGIVPMFERLRNFCQDPFVEDSIGLPFTYYFEIAQVATRGVIDNLLSNLDNVLDAEVRQSQRGFRMEVYQAMLIRASDSRVFYFEIVIKLRPSYCISIKTKADSSLFDNANNNGIEYAMENAETPRVRNRDADGGVGGGAVGSLLVFNTVSSFNDNFNLRLSAVLDELERSVGRLR